MNKTSKEFLHNAYDSFGVCCDLHIYFKKKVKRFSCMDSLARKCKKTL